MKVGLPLPEQVRRAILRARSRGLTYQEVADLLGVGFATVNRVLRLQRETGDVKPRPRGGGNLSPIRGEIAEELKVLVLATPDATIEELMHQLVARTKVETSMASMKRAMHRLGFSRKKRSSLPRSATLPRTSGAGDSPQRF